MLELLRMVLILLVAMSRLETLRRESQAGQLSGSWQVTSGGPGAQGLAMPSLDRRGGPANTRNFWRPGLQFMSSEVVLCGWVRK